MEVRIQDMEFIKQKKGGETIRLKSLIFMRELINEKNARTP